jgi:hypothetical protein
MPALKFQFNDDLAKRRLAAIKKQLTPAAQDRVVRKAAWVIHGRLVRQTPKRWTGHTRRSWTVFRRGNSHYAVTNKSKVMRFLEMGTKAHGPVTAKRLFIPLNRRAALAGPKGVFASGGKLKFGRDFVWAKRVRGIKARWIVRNYRPFAEGVVKAMMKLHIRNIIASVK